MRDESRHDRAVRLGLTNEPSGTYPFLAHVPEIGWYDIDVEVEWAIRRGMAIIERVTVSSWQEGSVEIDPRGSAIERAAYARLVAAALEHEDDIIARWCNGQ